MLDHKVLYLVLNIQVRVKPNAQRNTQPNSIRLNWQLTRVELIIPLCLELSQHCWTVQQMLK